MTTTTANRYDKIPKQWERFLSRGCSMQDFTKDLYNYLYQRFGFIAHYNRHQFWEERFGRPDGLRETIRAITECPDYLLGYKDEDREVSRRLKGILRAYSSVLLQQVRGRELDMLKANRAAITARISELEALK
jgi:hypothetical protein